MHNDGIGIFRVGAWLGFRRHFAVIVIFVLCSDILFNILFEDGRKLRHSSAPRLGLHLAPIGLLRLCVLPSVVKDLQERDLLCSNVPTFGWRDMREKFRNQHQGSTIMNLPPLSFFSLSMPLLLAQAWTDPQLGLGAEPDGFA